MLTKQPKMTDNEEAAKPNPQGQSTQARSALRGKPSRASKVACALTCTLLSAACEPSSSPPPNPELANTTQGSTTKQPEPGTRIDFVYHYPGQVQHNVFYHWQRVQGQYLDDRGQVVEDSLIENLRQAAQEKGLPSHQNLSCRAAQKQAQFRVSFEDPSLPSPWMAASNCSKLVPFNLIHQGQRYAQVSGDFGDALLKLLSERDPERWQKLPLEDGNFHLQQANPPPWEVPETNHPSTSLLDEITALWLAQYSSSLTPFPNAELQSLDLACSQERTPNCQTLQGLIQLKLDENVQLALRLNLENPSPSPTSERRLQVSSPSEIQSLANALKLNNLKAYLALASDDGPFLLQWQAQSDCKRIDALKPFFNIPKNFQNYELCDRYRLEHPTRSDIPSAIFYPKLAALWLPQLSPEQAQTLSLSPELPKKTQRQLSQAKQLDKQQLFLNAKAQLLIFEESDGRTRLKP